MRILKNILLTLIGLIAISIGFVYYQLQASLPLLNGEIPSSHILQAVSVERDKDGIPTIKASSREDASYALGYLHAQERYFQMDLLRRLSAGELSPLFGNMAIEKDKQNRIHRFRYRAKLAFAALTAKEQHIIRTYAQGVNDGLNALDAAPWEYLLLRKNPEPWHNEDSFLAMYSMYVALQQPLGETERTLGWLNDNLPQDIADFLTQRYSPWHSPLDDTQLKPVDFPTTKPDFRQQTTTAVNWRPNSQYDPTGISYSGDSGKLGSNNWAVAGKLTKTGSAMLAGDMHLGIRAPNTWYRASLSYSDDQGTSWSITGITLPGTPIMISGSNRHVVWAFTNSYGDWSDVIKLDTNAEGTQYRTKDGYQPFIEYKEQVGTAENPQQITLKETIWGPVIAEENGKPTLAYRWVAHDPEGSNLHLLKFENALSTEQVSTLANTIGIPAQNIAIADKNGVVGWTIAGPIPIKQGNLGDFPVSWADGSNAWIGYYDPENYPRVTQPAHGRIWSANSRMVGGSDLNKIGFGGYAMGARQKQIKDDLFAKDTFSEQDLLDIQLDDRALFMSRWHNLLIQTVFSDQKFVTEHNLDEAKQLLDNWGAAANIDSVGYNLTRNFRQNVIKNLFSELNHQMKQSDDLLSMFHVRNRLEEPVWQLVNRQPESWLPANADSWQHFFQEVFLITLDHVTDGHKIPLQQAIWGNENAAYIRHPLSQAIPFIGKFVDMPKLPQAGDSYMPRVAYRSFGASQRTVVSPGHEEQGFFHMPAGQTGHPLSPYFGNGHLDWLDGKPSPFLPGETLYKLTFAPDNHTNGKT